MRKKVGSIQKKTQTNWKQRKQKSTDYSGHRVSGSREQQAAHGKHSFQTITPQRNELWVKKMKTKEGKKDVAVEATGENHTNTRTRRSFLIIPTEFFSMSLL